MKILVSENYPLTIDKLKSWFPEYHFEKISARKLEKLVISSADTIAILAASESPKKWQTSGSPELPPPLWICGEAIDDETLRRKLFYAVFRYKLQREFQFTRLMDLAALGEIALTVLQDLNSSLQVILGFTQNLLAEQQALCSSAKEDLQLIEAEAKKCGKTVADLVSLMGPSQENTYVDLNQLLAKIVPLLQAQIRSNQLTIERIAPGNLPLVLDPPGEIQTVVISLLVLAVSLAHSTSTIYILMQEEKEQIVFTVKYSCQLGEKLSSQEKLLQNFLELTDINGKLQVDSSLHSYQLGFAKREAEGEQAK